jgi:hypothetical protein
MDLLEQNAEKMREQEGDVVSVRIERLEANGQSSELLVECRVESALPHEGRQVLGRAAHETRRERRMSAVLAASARVACESQLLLKRK